MVPCCVWRLGTSHCEGFTWFNSQPTSFAFRITTRHSVLLALCFPPFSLVFPLVNPADNLGVSYDHSQVQALGAQGGGDLSEGGQEP
jgi:hypothetical protein